MPSTEAEGTARQALKELALAQSGYNPCLNITNRGFDYAFVLRLADTRWCNSSPVVLCKFLIASVKYKLVPGI